MHMAEFGAGPLDYTCACFAALLNWLESGLVWVAASRMEDEIDTALVARWTTLQTAMVERLERDRQEGRIDDDKHAMALDLLTNLDRYEWSEAVEQFQAWAAWVRGEA